MDSHDGLIHASIMYGNGGKTVLDWQAVNEWEAKDGLLWVHLDYISEIA